VANATDVVKKGVVRWTDEFIERSSATLAAATTFYPNAMIGVGSAGYYLKFDDTALMQFAGVFTQDQGAAVLPIGTAGDNALQMRIQRPRCIEVALTSVAVTDIGRIVYASDDQTGSFTPGTYGNVIGTVLDVVSTSIALVECRYGVANGHPVQVYSASGAVNIRAGLHVITKAGVAAMTIADPTSGTHDGMELTVLHRDGAGRVHAGQAGVDVTPPHARPPGPLRQLRHQAPLDGAGRDPHLHDEPPAAAGVQGVLGRRAAGETRRTRSRTRSTGSGRSRSARRTSTTTRSAATCCRSRGLPPGQKDIGRILDHAGRGTTDLCFDGTAFFANSHTFGSGDNLMTANNAGNDGVTHKIIALNRQPDDQAAHLPGPRAPLGADDRRRHPAGREGQGVRVLGRLPVRAGVRVLVGRHPHTITDTPTVGRVLLDPRSADHQPVPDVHPAQGPGQRRTLYVHEGWDPSPSPEF
jgi:hypothetical protein